MAELIYQGRCIQCVALEDGVAELIFDHQSSSVNKFDAPTIDDLVNALEALRGKKASLKGLLVTSAKDGFIVGADVSEFPAHFRGGAPHLAHLPQLLGEVRQRELAGHQTLGLFRRLRLIECGFRFFDQRDDVAHA